MSEAGPWFLPPPKGQVCVCKQPQQPGLNKILKQGEKTIYKLPRTNQCIQKLAQIFLLPQTISTSSGGKKGCHRTKCFKENDFAEFLSFLSCSQVPSVCFWLQLLHASISIRLRSHLHLVHIQSPKCSSVCDLEVGSAVRNKNSLSHSGLEQDNTFISLT